MASVLLSDITIGSRKNYALNLENTMVFPDYNNIPVLPPQPGEGWIMLLEIVADVSNLRIRPVSITRDKTRRPYLVEFNTPNAWEDVSKCRSGHVICIKNERPWQFPGGKQGFKIKNPAMFEVLPVSMNELRELNANLIERSREGKLRHCVNCDQRCYKRCASCSTRYCKHECQKQHWPTHKSQCKALSALHRWNLTDWDNC